MCVPPCPFAETMKKSEEYFKQNREKMKAEKKANHQVDPWSFSAQPRQTEAPTMSNQPPSNPIVSISVVYVFVMRIE